MTRAGSALTALAVNHDAYDSEFDYICALLRASPALVEVHMCFTDMDVLHAVTAYGDMAAVLAAGPQLRELRADVVCDTALAVQLLERRPPLERVCLRSLTLPGVEYLRNRGHALPPGLMVLPPAFTAALADARLQPCLTRLLLVDINFDAPGAADALADAVVARPRLSCLILSNCALSPATAPALARVLRGGALTHVRFSGRSHTVFLDAAGALTLGEALRASSTLTSLTLAELPPLTAPIVTALLGALEGHRSLSKLRFCYATQPAHAGIGAALAALVAADAPALEELSVPWCGLGEDMGLLCDALPYNHHLRELNIQFNRVPAGLMRDRLLPAVRANASLRTLGAAHRYLVDEADMAAAREAEALVAAR